jgi:hypothetical protein
MKSSFRFEALRSGLVGVALLALLALPALAQVPQDMTFTGRLVNDLGNPISGPVTLELRVFNAETSGVQLYTEAHIGVPLDASGGFSVQLGMGTSPLGSFDAALFSDVDRWLEVQVGTEILTPRQIIGSVPWAFVAERANEIVRDPNAPRFEDCGDGTVADHQTGLLWEKKTGTVGTLILCETAGCPDPHDVNNGYEWSNTVPDPDGGAFTDFLPRLNARFDPFNPTGCFADRCDWRLPEISELQTILIGPDAAPGQATTCSSAPCVDPDFAAIDGPTASSGSSIYWAASTVLFAPDLAWGAFIGGGNVFVNGKAGDTYVRAVRTGSCN